MGGDGGVIGLDPSGEVVYAFNTTGMYRGSIDTSGELDVHHLSAALDPWENCKRRIHARPQKSRAY